MQRNGLGRDSDSLVFVYGSLCPGESAFRRLLEGRVEAVERVRIRGRLYHLLEGYPALCRGAGWVSGDLLRVVDPEVWPLMDAWEGFRPGRALAENHYRRETSHAWSEKGRLYRNVYVYRIPFPRLVRMGAWELPSGRWQPAIVNHSGKSAIRL